MIRHLYTLSCALHSKSSFLLLPYIVFDPKTGFLKRQKSNSCIWEARSDKLCKYTISGESERPLNQGANGGEEVKPEMFSNIQMLPED